MANKHVTVEIRCRFPWALYALVLCDLLPQTPAQRLANVLGWLACFQIRYGKRWKRLHVPIVIRRDDDDQGGGWPALAFQEAR